MPEFLGYLFLSTLEFHFIKAPKLGHYYCAHIQGPGSEHDVFKRAFSPSAEKLFSLKQFVIKWSSGQISKNSHFVTFGPASKLISGYMDYYFNREKHRTIIISLKN